MVARTLGRLEYVEPKFKRKSWLAAVQVEQSCLLPENNFGAQTKSRWWNKIFVDEVTDITWQPDVYEYARRLAEELEIVDIVDVGCGNGVKLSAAFNARKIKTIGVDYAGSLEIARKKFPRRQWQEANLMNADAVYQSFLNFNDETPRLYILSDVIEHLLDPRPALRELRKLLQLNEKNRLIISTPDVLVGQSYNKHNLPENQAHVREWSLGGLVKFLKSSGFTVHQAGLTRSNDVTGRFATSLIVLGADEQSVANTRATFGYAHEASTMIVTSEHADAGTTGGIGSYVKEVEEALGDEAPLILYCGHRPFKDGPDVARRPDHIIDIRDFTPDFSYNHTVDIPSTSWHVLNAVNHLLYLYGNIRLVEYQEWEGIAARLVEAKAASMIPPTVTLRARCHGSQIYVERAMRKWVGLEAAEVMLLEKTSLELSDEINFPSHYLRSLYEETGYDLSRAKLTYQRYPYRYPDEKQSKAYRPVDTLIFIGKRSTMKGYPDFCQAVEKLADPDSKFYLPELRRILVFGAPDHYGENVHYDNVLKHWAHRQDLKLIIDTMPRSELLKTLRNYHSRAVAVLPYTADNHPVTVLEMIANYLPFVAYKTGGVPELFPEKYHDDVLSLPNYQVLAMQLHNLCSHYPPARRKLMKNLHEEATYEQAGINYEVGRSYVPSRKAPKKKRFVHDSSLVTAMVPVYNKDFQYIKELISALNQQSLLPHEVIFVDDGSEAVYSADLEKLIDKELTCPYRFIRQKNSGLAGARNTALKACGTKYLVNIDADDIPLNDFIYDYVNTLENNPDFDIAICCLESFIDDGDFKNKVPDRPSYRYLGVGGSPALSLHSNHFGHASSCVRTAVAKKLGGWDASDKSKWEDWQFYLRATQNGSKIINIPKINYLYRISETSMVRSPEAYPNFSAELRIARSLSGSSWDSLRQFAIAKSQAGLVQALEASKPDPAYSSISVRVALALRQGLRRAPIVYRTTGFFYKNGAFVFRNGWNVYRFSNRKIRRGFRSLQPRQREN